MPYVSRFTSRYENLSLEAIACTNNTQHPGWVRRYARGLSVALGDREIMMASSFRPKGWGLLLVGPALVLLGCVALSAAALAGPAVQPAPQGGGSPQSGGSPQGAA